MKRQIVFGVIVSLAALLLVACGQEQAPVEEAAAPPAEPTMLEQAAEAAKEASDEVGETASDVADAAAEKAGEISDAAVEKAEEMIEQVKAFIAEDKMEMARELMDKLVALKDSVPEAIRAEIERLEAMFSGE
jgi:hypothetical protein